MQTVKFYMRIASFLLLPAHIFYDICRYLFDFLLIFKELRISHKKCSLQARSLPAEIVLQDVANAELSGILDFFYTGNLRFPQERLQQILDAAELLELANLRQVRLMFWQHIWLRALTAAQNVWQCEN